MSEKSNIPVEIPASGIDLLGKKTGWVIGARGYELMRLETDKHMISIASTGGGKGRAVVIPNLLTHHGSVFSVEIGGTSYKESASYRRHVMGQEVHLIDPLGALDEGTACFNVLDTLNPESPRFITEVTQVAESLLKDADGDKTQDPYFKHTPRALLAAFIIYVMTSDAVRDEDRHLPYVANLLGCHGSEKWHDLMNEFATDAGPYRDRLNKEGLYFRNKQTENTDSIVSTASIALSFARDPAFSRMLKTSSFKLSDLRDKKTSIYIVMPEIEHYKINAPLLRMLVERAFVACPNYGDGGRGFTHNDRVLFMLDEFTQLGKLDAVDTGMQTARQKGVTIWAIFQDLGRLEKLYGKEIAGSFLGAAGCVQVFDVGDERTKQYVSDRVGKGISYLPTVQHGVNWSQTQQSNWSETISLGINKTNTTGGSEAKGENWSRSIGTNETTSFGSNGSEGTTETYARRPVDSWFFAAPKPQSYAEQKNTGYSHTQATGKNETDMTGGSHVRTIQNSESTGTSEQEAKQNGGSQGVQQGGQYSVSFAPQILPKLQPADVEYFIGTDNRQIVFIRANNRVQNFIDFRANWDQIPYLRGCALGPDSNLMPYPELLPPLQGPLKLPAAISYTPEPLILDLPEFPAVSETKINLQTLQQMAGSMSPSGIWKFLPESWFNSKVRDEYEYISRQALKSAEAEIEYANKACEVYHPVSIWVY